MNGYRKEIPKWVWYIGQFLFHFQDQLANGGQMTVAHCFSTFKEAQQLQNCPGVQLKNQGTMLMLLYGLLVIPREMWNYQGLPEFPFHTRQEFQFCIAEENVAARKFLTHMRNAVAHANFDVNIENGTYTFWNTQNDGMINFKVKVPRVGLCKFVTEVGQYYINSVKPYVDRIDA